MLFSGVIFRPLQCAYLYIELASMAFWLACHITTHIRFYYTWAKTIFIIEVAISWAHLSLSFSSSHLRGKHSTLGIWLLGRVRRYFIYIFICDNFLSPWINWMRAWIHYHVVHVSMVSKRRITRYMLIHRDEKKKQLNPFWNQHDMMLAEHVMRK